uniref:uncharacterized protein LOC132675108 n=1 Tax=Panthera onca TaxID=9690 RepID=UPI002955CB3D
MPCECFSSTGKRGNTVLKDLKLVNDKVGSLGLGAPHPGGAGRNGSARVLGGPSSVPAGHGCVPHATFRCPGSALTGWALGPGETPPILEDTAVSGEDSGLGAGGCRWHRRWGLPPWRVRTGGGRLCPLRACLRALTAPSSLYAGDSLMTHAGPSERCLVSASCLWRCLGSPCSRSVDAPQLPDSAAVAVTVTVTLGGPAPLPRGPPVPGQAASSSAPPAAAGSTCLWPAPALPL